MRKISIHIEFVFFQYSICDKNTQRLLPFICLGLLIKRRISLMLSSLEIFLSQIPLSKHRHEHFEHAMDFTIPSYFSYSQIFDNAGKT